MQKNLTGRTKPHARRFVTLFAVPIFMASLLAFSTVGFAQDDTATTDPAPIVESGPELPPIADTVAEDPVDVAPAADDPAENADPVEDVEPLPFREQTIYIPYKDLRRTFEREGRGVFLPYEEFRRLWDAAREPDQVVEPEAPPVGALITETNNEANVSEEIVTVSAEITIELLSLGWHTIPLELADAAITEATIDGEPARLTQDPGGAGYQLLIENIDDGDEDDVSERITLQLTYAKAIQRSPGRNAVSFQAPRAAVSRWIVRIPESGVKVDFFPLIAATEESDEPEDPTTTEDAEETVVLAFVGSAPTVDIGWTPKAEGATGLEALATVQTEQQITIDEGVVRTRTQLIYTINRAELDRLAISIPADQRVLNVFDANVRGWSVNRGANEQTIDVQLFEPAKESQSIIIELEKFRDEEPGNAEVADVAEETVEEAVDETIQEPAVDVPWIVEAPVVRAIGVSRQQGIVVVLVGEELTAEATLKSGLMQIDPEAPEELSESLRVRSWELGNRSWDFAYRYATVPFSLQLTTEKVQPRIEADTLVEVSLRAERLTLDVSTIFTIERAGVFQLQCEIPDGYEIRRVTGRTFADAQAVSVETHHAEPAEEGWKLLTVNLSRKAIGKVGLLVSLERRLDEPALLTPTGESVEVNIPLPIVTGPNVERTSGRTIIYAPESLQVNPTLVEGLQVVAPEEATENTQVYVTPRDVRVILAHLFGEERASMSFELERRKPHITFRQSLVAEVQDGLIEYRATFFYTILYSGVPSLRIDIPVGIASTVRNDTPELREAVITEEEEDAVAVDETVVDGTETEEAAPIDEEGGAFSEAAASEEEEIAYVGWSFTGKSELIGEGRIVLSWEEPLTQLSIGGSVDVDVPRLVPQNADISSGEIVLAKAETIDLHIRDETSGLEPIDAQHELTLETDVTDGARAFRYHGPWNLAITAVRYELAEIRHTSVERALIRAVVHRSTDNSQNGMTVQALYRIKAAAGKQRLPISLPLGANITKSQINNAPILLETENADEGSLYYVPLIGLDPQLPFVLELQYSLSRDGDTNRGVGHGSGQGGGDGSGSGDGAGGGQGNGSGSGNGSGNAKDAGDGLRIEYPMFPAEPAVQEVYLATYLPETWDVLEFDGPWTRRFDWVYDDFEGRYDPEPRINDYALLTWIAEDTPVDDVSVWKNFPTDGRPVYLFSAIDPGDPSEDALQLTIVHRTILKSVTLIICVVLGLMLLAFKWVYRIGALVAIGIVGLAVYAFHPVLIMHIGQRTLTMGVLIILILWAAAFILKFLRKPEKLPSIRFNIRLWSDKGPKDWLSAKCKTTSNATGKPDETSPPPGEKPTGSGDVDDNGDSPFANGSDSPSAGPPPLNDENDDSEELDIVDIMGASDQESDSDDLPEGGQSDV